MGAPPRKGCDDGKARIAAIAGIFSSMLRAFLVAGLLVLGGRAQPAPPPFQTLFYTSEGLKLEAYLFKPEGPGPFPLVVYNHGSRAADARSERPVEYVARLLVPAGYAVLVPERRGYGKS